MNHAGPVFSATRRTPAAGLRSEATVASRRGAAAGIGSRKLPGAIRLAILTVIALFLHGCGEVDWFPEYVRLATTPDPFTFAAKTGTEKSTADKSVQVTSDAITVAGLTAESSLISVSGSLGRDSKYSINGGTATSAAGTVKNGDKVTITHTAADLLGTPTTSTLTIGTVSANFVSTTKHVDTPAFTEVVSVDGFRRTFAVIVTSGLVASHEVKIRDSLSSASAQYSVSDDFNPGIFTNVTQTLPLNTRRLYVQNLISNVDAGAITTLTIDGIDYEVTLTVTP